MMTILYAICLGWVLVNILQIHRRHPLLNRKPFSCDVCLAGWIAGILSLLVYFDLPYAILDMPVAMVGVILLNKLIR